MDHVRKEQAVYFLEKTNVEISEIAYLLGYSEQSRFNRAFKRWVGSTLGQFRTRIKSNQ
ncbi:MAG: helix-turn-helix transcriptional regulator [Desulfobacterium sp.]|nr:helix-turn-helix transcriptional regulator [Desulfobacterium sp.]